jgi:hypothetical protein
MRVANVECARFFSFIDADIFNLRYPFHVSSVARSHKFLTLQTMCASAAAGSMRIMLMPVDAWKTIKQVALQSGFLAKMPAIIPTSMCLHAANME